MKWALGALLVLAAAPALAQVSEFSKHKKPKEDSAPVALALNLVFSTTYWQQVEVSTSGPVGDVSALVRQGYYKLEIIELVMMSHDGRQPLAKTVEKRKKGADLADIAADYHLAWVPLEQSALAVEDIVDKQYLPLFPEKRRRKERDEW
ncbi:MAG: hypothetical protein HY077_02440 [Elusimicrobia bacterium]|nr:hypothetical protein [Elusimicrobiota bacterium]